MARVLLTGSSGLIGRATARALLDAGHEVVALTRSGTAEAGLRALACDLLDPEATARAVDAARADHLVHLAWHADARDRWVSPANLDWMTATIHLVRRFAEAGGTRAVCAGSCAEYDWTFADLSERTPLNPATLYGAAKAGTGLALSAAAPRLGLSLAWARIFFVYGAGEPRGRLLGDLIAGLRAGEPVECTDGLQERDFLHADDLGRLLAALLASELAGPVNVASGQAIPVRVLIAEIARQLGRPDLVRLGARPRPAADPPRLAADVSRLAGALGSIQTCDLSTGVAAILEAEVTA
ncbi:MAG: NAD(P)-dependent oxidoreductase [Rhodobacteraceae bacterium]|nr:NAD(P)-dependent oxidoreductase [Paracoccaceae bacterium]